MESQGPGEWTVYCADALDQCWWWASTSRNVICFEHLRALWIGVARPTPAILQLHVAWSGRWALCQLDFRLRNAAKVKSRIVDVI